VISKTPGEIFTELYLTKTHIFARDIIYSPKHTHTQKLKRLKQTKEIKYKVPLNTIQYFGDVDVKKAAYPTQWIAHSKTHHYASIFLASTEHKLCSYFKLRSASQKQLNHFYSWFSKSSGITQN